MVYLNSRTPVGQQLDMAKSVVPNDPYARLKQISQLHKAKKSTSNFNFQCCEKSPYAVMDLIILIAVIVACGFLVYPGVKLLFLGSLEFFDEFKILVQEEIFGAPLIYVCLGLSMFWALAAVLIITLCTTKKCGKPGCRGLRKAAEFDIQIETEEKLKNSLSSNTNKQGLFELPRDYHRELEAELKKMAPINGRAVLVFRAKCGCSVGRMEVPGSKKSKKIKK